MEGLGFIKWFNRHDDERSGKQKAIDLLLTGRVITSQQANKILGWKFATRISEAIEYLAERGILVEKGTYRRRFRTYQVKEG